MEEKALTAKKSGFSMLPLCFIVFASGAALFVYAIGHLERGENALGGFLLVVAILGYIAGIIALPGFKVLKPQEALVLPSSATMQAPCGSRASTGSAPSAPPSTRRQAPN